MPDVTATLNTAVLLIIVGNFDTIEDSLRGCDLVWTHNHQHILRRKNAIFCKDIQNRMLCEKGFCKINQIRNHTVIGICPETSKLKTITGLCLACSPLLMFFFCIPSGAVGIIFCVRTVGYDKNLNIFIQSASRPERIPLITIDLVKCLTNGNSSAFQFNMYKRQAIDQYCNIITVIIFCTFICANYILIDDLQSIVMDVLFIYECDILRGTIITSQNLNIVFLYFPGLFHDMLIGIGNSIFEKSIPFCVRKLIVVQLLQFLTKIDNQIFFCVNRQIFISLFTEQTDKLLLQFRFALVTVRTLLDWLIFCDNGILRCFRYNVKVRHNLASLLL